MLAPGVTEYDLMKLIQEWSL